jgi:hypothetical protein
MWRTILYSFLILLFGCDLPNYNSNDERLLALKYYRGRGSETPDYIYDPNTNICAVYFPYPNRAAAVNVECARLPKQAKKYFGFVVEEEKKCP